MSTANDYAAVKEMFSDEPLLAQFQLVPHAARVQLVEEMDAEIEACTDPELKKEIEAECSAIRMMLRMWQPIEMSPEDEAVLNEHFTAKE